MLKIIVLGGGLIPRSNGIAPRLNPFDADEALIKLIIMTEGMDPYFINPVTHKKVLLTMSNYKKMYATYGNVKKKKPIPKFTDQEIKEIAKEVVDSSFSTNNVKPQTPEVKPEPKVEPKPEMKPEENKENNSLTLPVISNDPPKDDKSNNNHNGNKNKK